MEALMDCDHTANEKDEPQLRNKKPRKLEIRDLKAKADPTGGAQVPKRSDKKASPQTGEVDFMGWD
jgi:hypothetical protein